MGLPQVSSGNISEEVSTTVSTIMQIPARFGGPGSFGVEPDVISLHKDGVTKLRIDSLDKNRFLSHNGGKSIQTPASRIVGFEPSGLMNCANQYEEKQLDSGVPSSHGKSLNCNSNENSSSTVRKRLLSPLNGILLNDDFIGDNLEIGNTSYHNNFQLGGSSYNVTLKENKKAHIGNLDYNSPPIWYAPNLSSSNSPQGEDCKINSRIITDGPILENQGRQYEGLLSSYHDVTCSGTIEPLFKNGATNISRDTFVSTPLSLSPLGPRFCGRMRNSEESVDSKKGVDGGITFKDVEQSLEGTISSFVTSHRDENVIMARKRLEDDENFLLNFDQLTPESLISIQGHNTKFTNQNAKLGRSLSGLLVRRSLVGSFEESLLSGRLASGIVNQVCFFSLN